MHKKVKSGENTLSNVKDYSHIYGLTALFAVYLDFLDLKDIYKPHIP